MLTFTCPTCPILWTLSIIFLVATATVDAKNILIYQALGTISTRLSMWPYVEALAEKGHNLTFLSAFKDNENLKPHPNINCYVPTNLPALVDWEGGYRYYDARKNLQVASTFYSCMDIGIQACQALYSDPEFVTWLKSSQFDLVVIESASNECAYGLVHYFKAKHIMYSTLTAWPHYMDQFGLPVESSSIPDVAYAFPPGDRMSFWQRLVNTLHPLAYHMKRKYWHLPALEEITKGGLGLEVEELPSFEEIERNVSLIFLTSHYSLEYARSLPPYVIPIGGVVSAGKNVKPLTEEIDKFVKEANSGFVFISFGTVAEFTNFDEGVQQEFILALANFPEMRFVWALPKGTTITLPDNNVLVTKWASQQTLLAHSNIKAIITHAGVGSIVEAIHHSVPMILIPVLCDQDLNAESVASKGAGIRLEIVDMKEEELTHAISEILHNEKYRKGMNTLTDFFHERPMPPLESAVWWTEFILKHDDSKKFLHPPSQLLPWYVKRGLDVWATVLLVVTLTIGLSLYIVFAIVARFSKLLFGTISSAPRQKSSKKLKRK